MGSNAHDEKNSHQQPRQKHPEREESNVHGDGGALRAHHAVVFVDDVVGLARPTQPFVRDVRQWIALFLACAAGGIDLKRESTKEYKRKQKNTKENNVS